MRKGPDFTVGGEDEARIRDLAHQLLDATRAVVGGVAMPEGVSGPNEPLALEMTAFDIAVQTLFMADHLGGKAAVAKDGRTPVMNARRMGVASGLGQIIGTTPSALAFAMDMTSATIQMEKAGKMRFRDSVARVEKMRKEGKL